jgi:hypothetical protein
MSKATAITLLACVSKPKGLNKRVKAKNNGPLNNASKGFHLVSAAFSKGTIWVKINHLCILLHSKNIIAQGNCHIDSILH